jgi:hypothetical protein
MGIVKMSHHTDFDEAWYLQPNHPLAAQLLYNLGLENEDEGNADKPQEQTAFPTDLKTPWPPCHPLPLSKGKWNSPTKCYIAPVLLWELAMPQPITARAARVHFDPAMATDHEQFPKIQQVPKISLVVLPYDFIGVAAHTKATLAAELVSKFLITKHDIAPYTCHRAHILTLSRKSLTSVNSISTTIGQQASALPTMMADSSLVASLQAPWVPNLHIGRQESRARGSSRLVQLLYLQSRMHSLHSKNYLMPVCSQ